MEFYNIIKGSLSSITYSESNPDIVCIIKETNESYVRERYIRCYINENKFFERSDEMKIHMDYYIGDNKQRLNPTPVGKSCIGIYKGNIDNNFHSLLLNDIIIYSFYDQNSENIVKAIRFIPSSIRCCAIENGEKIIGIYDTSFAPPVRIKLSKLTNADKGHLMDAYLLKKNTIFFVDSDNNVCKIVVERENE